MKHFSILNSASSSSLPIFTTNAWVTDMTRTKMIMIIQVEKWKGLKKMSQEYEKCFRMMKVFESVSKGRRKSTTKLLDLRTVSGAATMSAASSIRSLISPFHSPVYRSCEPQLPSLASSRSKVKFRVSARVSNICGTRPAQLYFLFLFLVWLGWCLDNGTIFVKPA